MSNVARRWSLSLSLLLLSLFVMAVADRARGQAGATQLGNSAQIEKDFRAVKPALLEFLNSGGKGKGVPPEALDTAAKYYAYRLTWPSVLEAKVDPGKFDPLVTALNDFREHINSVLRVKANDPAFFNAYSLALVARFKEFTDMPVVENSRSIVHGAQMLPMLAKLQHDSIGKYLVELIDPKTGKHDLIKLWAIRALREFMPVDPWAGDIDPALLQDKSKLARKAGDLERINALTSFILRPPPPMATPEELEAFRFLRRDAIETLAQAGAPAVAAFVGKGRAVEGPIAPVLVRVLIPGDLTPETNLHEKNEAALGLCNMKANPLFESSPSYYFIAKTFIDLAKDYNEDWANIKTPTDQRLLPTKFPWKFTAKRWDGALKKLGENAPKTDKTAAQIENKGKRIADLMFQSKQLNVDEMDQEMSKLPTPPAEFSLFKSTIKSTPLKWDGAK